MTSLLEGKRSCEVMAPVGDFESLAAAIQGGAHSVYFGVEQLNMRAKSTKNFTIADMKTIAKKCSHYGLKCYLTMNTILYDHDIKVMQKILTEAMASAVNAVIASDVAVFQHANKIGLPVHISTQCNVSNLETLKFYAQFADVVVLARELTLTQIQNIIKGIKRDNVTGFNGELIRVEAFVHGAMCVAVSGKCYMSLATQNSSANRGACNQTCRKGYSVTDLETGVALELDNEYIMSPKDMCTIEFLDQLIDAGISVLKIEGRGRSPDYVFKVSKAYREMLDDCLNGTFNKEKAHLLREEMTTVYNRGFWDGGYYMGKQLGEWSGKYGSHSTVEKVYAGKCTKFYNKIGVAEIHLEASKLNLPAKIMIIGPTTGVEEFTIDEMQIDNGVVTQADAGTSVAIKTPRKVRKNDRLYFLKERANA